MGAHDVGIVVEPHPRGVQRPAHAHRLLGGGAGEEADQLGRQRRVPRAPVDAEVRAAARAGAVGDAGPARQRGDGHLAPHGRALLLEQVHRVRPVA